MSFMRKIKLRFFFYHLSLTRALKEKITVGHSFCFNGFIKTNSSHFLYITLAKEHLNISLPFAHNRTVLGAIFFSLHVALVSHFY
jgi:hypothetical protein